MKYVFVFFALFTLYNCSVQKRHYRAGWTISWHLPIESKGSVHTTKERILDSANVLVEDRNEPSFTSFQEPKMDTQSYHSISEKQVPSVSLVKNGAIYAKQKLKDPILQKSVEKKKVQVPNKNYKSAAYVQSFLALITFIADLFCYQAWSTSLSLDFIFYSLSLNIFVFFILLFITIVLLILARLNYKKHLNSLRPDYQYTRNEVKRNQKKELKKTLKAEGIKNRTGLWLIMAAVCIVLGLLSAFLLEYGVILSILLAIPLLFSIMFAIVSNINYYNILKYRSNNETVPKFEEENSNHPQKKFKEHTKSEKNRLVGIYMGAGLLVIGAILRQITLVGLLIAIVGLLVFLAFLFFKPTYKSKI